MFLISDFISGDVTVFSSSQSCTIQMISDFCVAAIHQRLESDGTERVEGSMTQRLENILNSKHLFFLGVQPQVQSQRTCIYYTSHLIEQVHFVPKHILSAHQRPHFMCQSIHW